MPRVRSTCCFAMSAAKKGTRLLPPYPFFPKAGWPAEGIRRGRASSGLWAAADLNGRSAEALLRTIGCNAGIHLLWTWCGSQSSSSTDRLHHPLLLHFGRMGGADQHLRTSSKDFSTLACSSKWHFRVAILHVAQVLVPMAKCCALRAPQCVEGRHHVVRGCASRRVMSACNSSWSQSGFPSPQLEFGFVHSVIGPRGRAGLPQPQLVAAEAKPCGSSCSAAGELHSS